MTRGQEYESFGSRTLSPRQFDTVMAQFSTTHQPAQEATQSPPPPKKLKGRVREVTHNWFGV
jgi:hypothetical protein